MEINPSHSQQNVALNQVAGSRRTAPEELAERPKPTEQEGATPKNQAVSGDTLVLSEESLKRSQAAVAQPNGNSPQIANREQAQQVLGELISGVNRQPGLAIAAQGNTSADRVRTLLN
ncbi:hypothetical protein NP603_13550 [Methylomonas sp. SURF-1]|uniref:Uncharacterized protein n=1 Tax=Methylomonas aurea TaxID=2952224 RepID=A0ABT1UJD8_9GAMM|nr:hypothetical protein [Methylomonas sp. SURF-1]MCQ8182141.1 hypothetical protein [Methylomonas sp. SURF-1]